MPDAPTPETVDEIGWVIENGASPTEYWTGRALDYGAFSSDHAVAVRFARFSDAETIRILLLDGGAYCRSAQHMWIAAPAPTGPHKEGKE